MSKSSSTNYPNGFFLALSHFLCVSSYIGRGIRISSNTPGDRSTSGLMYESKLQSFLGGYSGEVPPLPIPNREVKLTNADGTALIVWESR